MGRQQRREEWIASELHIYEATRTVTHIQEKGGSLHIRLKGAKCQMEKSKKTSICHPAS
jgi:hypothetical protein